MKKLLSILGLAVLPLHASPQDNAATVVAENAIQAQAAVDSDGTIYVTFIRNGNIEMAASKDGGGTFGAPVTAIDAKGKLRGELGKVMQRGPRIGVDAKKNIYITAPACFDQSELTKQYPASDLWLVSSTDGGAKFSKPLQINEVPKKAAEALHWMAVSPSGEVHVGWLDFRDGGGQSLYYVKVTDQGKKAGKNLKVAFPLCECCAPGLTVDGKGNPILAFREGGKKASREIFVVVSKDGGKSFTGPTQINRTMTKEDS